MKAILKAGPEPGIELKEGWGPGCSGNTYPLREMF